MLRKLFPDLLLVCIGIRGCSRVAHFSTLDNFNERLINRDIDLRDVIYLDAGVFATYVC